MQGSPTDVIIVPDGNGNYLPVLIGVSVSEIDAFMRMVTQQNPEPLYSIQSLSVEGQVADGMANLKLQLRIQTKNEPIIRVPIGLKSGIFPSEMDLSQAAQYEGPSRFDIRANPQGEGYEIILQAKPSEPGTPPATPEHAKPGTPPNTPETAPEPVPADEGVPTVPAPATESAPVTEPVPETAVVPPADQPAAMMLDAGLTEDESETQRIWHTVTLRMAFPVTQPSTNEYLLKAEFPAALSSHVQLEVPLPEAVVMQSKGGSLRQTVPFNEQSTLFVFQGIHNDFEVQWHEKQHAKVTERVILQVEKGNIVARVNPTGVLFDATIPIQSSGGTFDSFFLQLPQGAVYRPPQNQETTEYQVEELPREQQDVPDDPSKALPQVLAIRLSQPTEGPVPVRIQAETPINHSQNGWFEVGGFEVLGAEKQFGKLSVIVPRETRLRQQNEGRGIRPSVEAAVSETEGIVYGFDYYDHPCSLQVQAVPQATRIYLRPEYQVQINGNRAVLFAKLSYTIHGGLNRLAMNMNGWQLTDVAPDNVAKRDELPFMEDGPVTIALQEPVGKKVELNLRAERSFDSGEGLIRFPFPIPDADSIEPALVAVIPADNIELSDDENHPTVEMSRKSRRNTPLEIELPSLRQQGALVYQIEHPAKAEFCAKVTLQKQKITAQSQTELSLQTSDQVKQTLQYTVEYEPVSRLVLAVPSELDMQGGLRVLYETRSLTLFDLPDQSGRGISQNGVVLKQVVLPDARIGTFQLSMEFKLKNQIRTDLAAMQPKTTVQVEVPVILPHDGRMTQETVTIRYPRGLQLNHDEEATSWKKKESPPSTTTVASRSESVYQTEKATPLLLLGASLKNAELSGVTTIEKGWLRSWLLGSGRYDCACYRVSSNMSHLTMTLPEQTRTDSLNVKLDNRKIEPERNGRELRIPLLPPANGSVPSAAQSSTAWLDLPENESSHILEIRYEVSGVTSLNRFTLEMPTFPRDVLLRPAYCQVMMPSSRHLLTCNADWMTQHQWRFDGGFFSRKPDLTQQELEDWVGVPHAEPISPELNSYLFISFHPESNVVLDLADRSTLVLVSSGVILLIGLIFIYFPRTRYPGVLFTSLVLFVSLFAYRVTLTIVFLQAGVIGFMLVLIASFLYRMFVSADPWRLPAPGSLSGIGRKTPSRTGRYVIPPTEKSSDPARVKVLRSDSADSVAPIVLEEEIRISVRPEDNPPPLVPDQGDDSRRENANADAPDDTNASGDSALESDRRPNDA